MRGPGRLPGAVARLAATRVSSGEVAGRKAHDGVSADRASSLTCTGAGVSALLLISALWLGEPDNVVGVIHAAVARRTGP